MLADKPRAIAQRFSAVAHPGRSQTSDLSLQSAANQTSNKVRRSTVPSRLRTTSQAGHVQRGTVSRRCALRLPKRSSMTSSWVSLGSPLIRSDVVAAIKATARTLVAPQLADIFNRAQPFFQPIFELAPPQIVFGRVALVGDAAFVLRPHAGAGTTKAALDAACLADALSAHGLDEGLS